MSTAYGPDRLVCPVCRRVFLQVKQGDAGAMDHRVWCSSCGVVVKLPRKALERAMSRAERRQWLDR